MSGVFLECPECGSDVTTLPGQLDDGDIVWTDGDTAECPNCSVYLMVDADEGRAELRVTEDYP